MGNHTVVSCEGVVIIDSVEFVPFNTRLSECKLCELGKVCWSDCWCSYVIRCQLLAIDFVCFHVDISPCVGERETAHTNVIIQRVCFCLIFGWFVFEYIRNCVYVCMCVCVVVCACVGVLVCVCLYACVLMCAQCLCVFVFACVRYCL